MTARIPRTDRRASTVVLTPQFLHDHYEVQGMGIREIALLTRRGHTSVRCAMELAGVQLRPTHGRSPRTPDQVANAYQAASPTVEHSGRVDPSQPIDFVTDPLWSIYALVDPRTLDVRYVGQSSNVDQRTRIHFDALGKGSTRNPAKAAWIVELRAVNMTPKVVILEIGTGDIPARDAETCWLQTFSRLGCELLNAYRPGRVQRIRAVHVTDRELPGLSILPPNPDGHMLPSNLLNKIRIAGSCWIWIGARTGPKVGTQRTGYGVVQHDGSLRRAHRVTYTYLVGPIPVGMVLDHNVCLNRACVFPGHLEPVTNKVNILRGNAPSAIHARKTHCVNGHPFTPENTRFIQTQNKGRGTRRCVECERARDRARYRRTVEARKVAA